MASPKYKERTIVCSYCGKIHTARMKPNRKFCSADCKNKAPKPERRNGKYLDCGMCGTLIYVSNKPLLDKQNHFCSIKCANDFQAKDKLKFVCKTCNKDFFWSKSRIKKHSPTFCSIDCRNQDGDWYRNAVIEGNLVQQTNKGRNKLELLGRTILESVGVKFEEQILIADKFLVDVYLPEHNVVIQWDGDYWHGHPSKLKDGKPDNRQEKRMKLDISQDAYMKKCGITVIRFWENEVIEEVSRKNDNIKRTIREITRKI
jgi:very-short-patch-repair endonuclease